MLANVDVNKQWNVFFYANTQRRTLGSSSAFRNKQIIILKSIHSKLDKKTRVINHIITVYFGKYLQIFDLSQYFPSYASNIKQIFDKKNRLRRISSKRETE